MGQIAERASLTGDRTESHLERMVARGWVTKSAGSRYGLVCDTERLLVPRSTAIRGWMAKWFGAERSKALRTLLSSSRRGPDEASIFRSSLLESETA